MGLSDAEIQRYIDEPGERSSFDPREVAQAFLTRIDRLDPMLGAVIATTPDAAAADAARATAARSAGAVLPLDGMPVLLKDNIDVAGVRTTVGSRCFIGRIAAADAAVVERLRAAGAVVLGKAHLHEFAFGATSNSAMGTCHNPWDLSRIPGGSSGGSGAALAADFAVVALGTDTGGSIRLPSGYNGVSGIRPTIGAVSNRGVQPLAPTFDTIGPMARAVEDMAAAYRVMAGYDDADPYSLRRPSGEGARESIAGMRVALLEDYFFESVDAERQAATRAAISALEEAGARRVNVSPAGLERAYRECTLMVRAEALATYAELVADEDAPMGADVRHRLGLAREISGREYAAMLHFRYQWRREIERLFAEHVDILITPTTPSDPPEISGSEMLATTTLLTRMTHPWSFAGLPAMSIPCGFSAAGFPIGMQLAAAPWNEEKLFSAGSAFQRVTGWHRRRPSFAMVEGAAG